MTEGGLRSFLVAVVAVVIALGSVGVFMWYVLSIPVGTSLILYALLLSIFVLFPVSLIGYVFKADARVRAQRDQKLFETFMERHPGKKLLGCIVGLHSCKAIYWFSYDGVRTPRTLCHYTR